MAYRRFEITVGIEVAAILLTCVIASYLITTTTYYATILLVLITLVIQVVILAHYVQRTNRELSRFLFSIQHADFSQSFSGHEGGAFSSLAESIEMVLHKFRETRAAKEEQSSYLNTLVQHVPVAMLAIDEEGSVDLFNHAARRLFGVNELRNIRDYTAFGADFPRVLSIMEPGQPMQIKVTRGSEVLHLIVLATELQMRGRKLKIVSLQDIRHELEGRELTAWQNLIRVLTHEIMNSMTPISSLATTASELLQDALEDGVPDSAMHDAREAVNTIAQRGRGLVRFVESYQRLTHLPEPKLSEVSVAELFGQIKRLMAGELEERSIAFTQSVSHDAAEVVADVGLIEQAVINLMKNAIEAVSEVDVSEIRMSAQLNAAGRPMISITDNGPGIDGAARESIFIPFYTTKHEGTGVGLTVVQQIMRSHNGTVEVVSSPDDGTSFRLVF